MFKIFLGKQPQKFLKKIERGLRERILEKSGELQSNPFPSDVKRIVGRKERAFRVRVGDYRIQYYVINPKKEIIVFKINKRAKAFD